MKLLMPFVNTDPNFTLGFEAGQMWEKMERGLPFNDYTFHLENKRQVEMMCKRFGYGCAIHIVDETWATLTAELTQ